MWRRCEKLAKAGANEEWGEEEGEGNVEVVKEREEIGVEEIQ